MFALARLSKWASAALGDGVILESDHACSGQNGARTRLRSHAILGRDCELGEDGTLHEHAVVGGEGFALDYARTTSPLSASRRGLHRQSLRARGAVLQGLRSLTISPSVTTPVQPHVPVGHNAKARNRAHEWDVWSHGSSVLEDDVVLAAAIVKDHVTVHQGATIGMDACVISDVPAGEVWSGSPARPHRQFLRSVALINRLARTKPGHST